MRSLPRWTIIVETTPRPWSILDSMIFPSALHWPFAFNSRISAWRRTASSNSSIPSFFRAEIFTYWVSPPHSSGVKPYSESWVITLSGLASGLSTLFTATTIGTLASFAWLIASTVWGITPSSAATTRITISVIAAPRARIIVKASCPGVSRKVILPFGVSTI